MATANDGPGFTARIVDLFLGSNLSLLLLVASLAAGVVALAVTPREEDPQISVPMADVIVQMPGASAAEVENLVTTNLEKRLWEMDGVSHIYSASQPGVAMVTVRFSVGYDRTKALVEIYNKLESNRDAVPTGYAGGYRIAVGLQLVVNFYQCFGAVVANAEPHGHHRHPGLRGRVNVTDAVHFPQALFEVGGDQIFDLGCACSGHLHDDVRHRYRNLRIFLAWRDGKRNHAGGQRGHQ